MGKPQAATAFADSVLTTGNNVTFDYKSLEDAFPKIDPGIAPFGTTCLFQIRHPKLFTKGGIMLIQETRSTEHYNTQIAKVLAMGPLAFMQKNRETGELEEWPEGKWFKVGDYVRLPRHGGDRFTVPFAYQDQEADGAGVVHPVERSADIVCVLHRAVDVLGKYTGDPLRIKAHVD